jgi:hypothetical protein
MVKHAHETPTIPYGGSVEIHASDDNPAWISARHHDLEVTGVGAGPGLILYRGHEPVLITAPVQIVEPNRGQQTTVLVERTRPSGGRAHEPRAQD